MITASPVEDIVCAAIPRYDGGLRRSAFVPVTWARRVLADAAVAGKAAQDAILTGMHERGLARLRYTPDTRVSSKVTGAVWYAGQPMYLISTPREIALHAIRRAEPGRGLFVPLFAVRDALAEAGITGKTVQDAALISLHEHGDAELAASTPHQLDAQLRSGAVRRGGTDLHLICIPGNCFGQPGGKAPVQAPSEARGNSPARQRRTAARSTRGIGRPATGNRRPG